MKVHRDNSRRAGLFQIIRFGIFLIVMELCLVSGQFSVVFAEDAFALRDLLGVEMQDAGIEISEIEPQPDGTLRIFGTAPGNREIADLMKQLEDSPNITKVGLVLSRKLLRSRIEFELRAQIIGRSDSFRYQSPDLRRSGPPFSSWKTTANNPSVSVHIKVESVPPLSNSQAQRTISHDIAAYLAHEYNVDIDPDEPDWIILVNYQTLPTLVNSSSKTEALLATLIVLQDPFREQLPIYQGSLQKIVTDIPELKRWVAQTLSEKFFRLK